MIIGFEQITKNLPPTTVHKYAQLVAIEMRTNNVGKKNKIKNEQLQAILAQNGYTVSDIQVREVIHYLRLHFQFYHENKVGVIVADSKGYRLEFEPIEIVKYKESLRQRWESIKEVFDSIQNNVQLSLVELYEFYNEGLDNSFNDYVIRKHKELLKELLPKKDWYKADCLESVQHALNVFCENEKITPIHIYLDIHLFEAAFYYFLDFAANENGFKVLENGSNIVSMKNLLRDTYYQTILGRWKERVGKEYCYIPAINWFESGFGSHRYITDTMSRNHWHCQNFFIFDLEKKEGIVNGIVVSSVKAFCKELRKIAAKCETKKHYSILSEYIETLNK